MASISINPVKQPSFTSKFVTKDLLTNIFTYKGSVDSYTDLPNENLKIGDVYNVVNEYVSILDNKHYPAGTNWVWNGTEWDPQSGDITAQINSAINKLNVDDTAIEGLYISSVSESAGKIKVTHSEFPIFKPAWSINERDYSKEYFTVKTNAYIGVYFAEPEAGEAFFKKLNLHPNNTNTLELEWYNAVGVLLFPGEEVIIKSDSIKFFNYTKPKLTIFVHPDAPEFIENPEIIIQGNIASLVYGDDFIGKTILYVFENRVRSHYFFQYFFMNSHITDASNLILPFVYNENTLTGPLYQYMFKNNQFLKYAPKELPATTLLDSCYLGMFLNCTNLITAPKLPATTLTYRCYSEMFLGCSSLTTAPELPATTLADYCYASMFYGCTSLKSIIMLTPITNKGEYFNAWLYNVSPSGTFVKNKNLDVSLLSRNHHGIPEGWTVIDYKEPNSFIYAKTKDFFLEELEAGNVSDEAIVFIEDTKEIWNHGTYFEGGSAKVENNTLIL